MLHVSVYWVSFFAPWDDSVYMQQAGSPREGTLSEQQAALAHSCPTSVTVLPPDRSAALPQAAPRVLSAPVAPAQGSCNKRPCRELPAVRCPDLSCPAVVGCPLMEACPVPQQQGWGQAEGVPCPCNVLPCRGHGANLESPSWLWYYFWLGGRKVTIKCSPQPSSAPSDLAAQIESF